MSIEQFRGNVMRVAYFRNGTEHVTHTDSTDIVLELISNINNIDINYAHLWFDSGSLSIIGGHETRVVVVEHQLPSLENIISGRLVDTEIASRDSEIELLSEDGKFYDTHKLYLTVERSRAIEVAKSYLTHKQVPQNTRWGFLP
jgi:hypothetical protein